MNATQILLVNPCTMERTCMGNWLSSQPTIKVLGQAADGPEAIRKSRAATVPHVVLTELFLPGWSGIELTRRMQILPRRPQVIAFSSVTDEWIVDQLAYAGAYEYMDKSQSMESLLHTVQAAGQAPKSGVTPLQARVCQPKERQIPDQDLRVPVEWGLTNREAQVLQSLILGLDNREIADHLCIAARTVQTHFQRIYAKLNVHSRTHALMVGLRTCLIMEPLGSPKELGAILRELSQPE